jgi:hypothetical protein
MNEDKERQRKSIPSRTCPVCDLEFSRADSARRHLLSAHDPTYSEADPRRRRGFARRLSEFEQRQKDRMARVMANPVEVTAPEAGKVRVRSIKPGAPSKDEEEEGSETYGESEVPIATVKGPTHGPAAVPVAKPRRSDGPGLKSKSRNPNEPDIPTFPNGATVRVGGDHFRVSDGRLKWVVFPRDNGTKLEEGDRFRIGAKTFEIIREESPLGLGSLGLFVSLKAKEITESPKPSRKPRNRAEEPEEGQEETDGEETEEPEEEEEEEEEEEPQPQAKPKHSGNPWLSPFFGGSEQSERREA